MINKIKKNVGFTLIEIVVVLIILGVLAAVGLPALFGNVERSRSAEALSNLSSIRQNVEACIMAAGGSSATGCQNVAAPASTSFQYNIVTGANAVVTIVASRTGLGAGNIISLTRTGGAAGVWACGGAGSYVGVCN